MRLRLFPGLLRAGTPVPAFPIVAYSPEDALGSDEYDNDDREPEDHALNPGEARAELGVEHFGNRDEYGGADHRAPNRADAAEHRHRQRLRGDEHTEHGRRRDHEKDDRVEGADSRRERAADGDRAQLPSQCVDPGRLGRRLVLLDRKQGHAESERSIQRVISTIPTSSASANAV